MWSGSMSRAECLGAELTPSRVKGRAIIRKILNNGLPCRGKITLCGLTMWQTQGAYLALAL
jgi:hypothetical protein